MFLIIGTLIGLVLGLTGSGGSVFAVPLLVLLTGVSMYEAVGLSLAAVSASAIFGSLRLRARQPVLWLPALLLGVSGMVAAPAGQWAARRLPELVLLLLFVVIAILIAWRMWLTASRQPEQAAVTRASDLRETSSNGVLCRLSPTGQFQLKPRCMGGLLVGGLMIGLLSGLLGVGGGFVIVPLLLFLSQVTMQQAVSTSLVVISVISTTGFLSYLFLNQPTDHVLSYSVMAYLVAGGIAGMLLGQLLTKKIADDRLQKTFAIALLLTALALLGSHLFME